MHIVSLNIKLIEGNVARIHGRNLFQYKAEVIRDEGKYYYRIDNVILDITPLEAKRVIRNPCLYYFSTALWLHLEIQRKKDNPNYIRNFN
jgi:hypothetical protein